MTPREPASDRLERLLWILPTAARPGGIDLSELADELGVRQEKILDDLEEVTTRSFHHPPEWITDVEIYVEAERVTVWTTGHFRRPVRLDRTEALALALALRVAREETDPDRRAEVESLRRRLDATLPVEPAGSAAERFDFDVDDPGGDRLLAVLRDAARQRRPCAIEYLKPDEAGPRSRRLEPYVLVFAEGRWYVMGRDPEADDVRAFRLDRTLSVEVEDDAFEVPDEFDPDTYMDEGAVYRADDEIEVAVRYSERVAPWVEEWADVESCDDGAVVVRHRVANPAWVVRHVLRYGAEAEVVGPPEMREAVRERLARLGSGAIP